ncbi:MAG TPA: DNA gyrase subunit A [Candidatus Acidoferrales bacterium]|jgi:DNA gyrase subunit A|nr:DNA gyrase subunit A [Candidatus Acidoferrales bacterium]
MADEQNQSILTPVDIESEMKKSYLDYAMSVIIGRALPDVRDGLKPVHRRILFGMYELGLTSTRPYRKCAKIVGEVLGKYHPHGDSPVYDALVRLAQDFNMRYPLVDGQGNYGSIDGDPPAAMRYTEARLSKIAEEMLADIEKETVDFVPNFDESEHEPVVLPTRIPNLLVNGSTGIAVGMATNIPPHNLKEIVEAAILLIDEPDSNLKKVMKLVPGPDFPTGGYIYGREGIEQAYTTGRGSFQVRAKAAIEQRGKDRQDIIVTELPYQVNKARLIEHIADLIQNKKIEGIGDIRDESDRDGMRIVIEIKRDEEPQIILNKLYKLTQMQESFGMILLAIVAGQPRELGLLDLLRLFIEHRIDVVRRRTQYELRKAREREHILLGYRIALDYIDDVIKVIRGSSSRANARENLHDFFQNKSVRVMVGNSEQTVRGVKLDAKKYGAPVDVVIGGETFAVAEGDVFGLTYPQIEAILELQLHRLTRLSIDEIVKELAQLRDRIAELMAILASDKKLKGVIVSELREVLKAYGDDRRTQIVDRVEEIKLEDLIKDEEMAITVSHAGYIKRTSVDVYRHQSRGGKGRIGARTREEDFVEHFFVASAHSYILLFTSKGRVYWLKVYEIPEAAAATRGKAINSIVRFQENEKLTAVVPTRNLEEADRYVFLATRNGTVKKTTLAEFSNPRPSGIIAINLDDNDELIGAKLTDGKHMTFLASHDGQAILFRETEVRAMGRQAGGVNGMDLAKDDFVVSMDAVKVDFDIVKKEFEKDTQNLDELESDEIRESLTSLMLTVAEKGYGKRTPLAEYRVTSRGGKGVINLKSTDRNGSVVAALQVREESDVMIITSQGKVIRVHSGEIREAGRSTQGVRLLRLDEGDRVVAAAAILEEEEAVAVATEPEKK